MKKSTIMALQCSLKAIKKEVNVLRHSARMSRRERYRYCLFDVWRMGCYFFSLEVSDIYYDCRNYVCYAQLMIAHSLPETRGTKQPKIPCAVGKHSGALPIVLNPSE